MTYSTALRELNEKFNYKSDNFDKWQILKTSPAGYLHGDCEDYALTLQYMAAGKSMIKFWLAALTLKQTIWYCKSPSGGGHAISYVRGYGWIDNREKRFMTRKEVRGKGYRLYFPYVGPLLALKMVIGAVL